MGKIYKKRETPNKKWSEKEVKTILDFMQEYPELEAPTAQIYYKKLIEKSGMNATWELIRWKVRHLKLLFKKATNLRESTGADLLEYGTESLSIEDKVLQICPHFYQLNKIFGTRLNNSAFEMDDCTTNTIQENSFPEVKEESAPQLDCRKSKNLPQKDRRCTKGDILKKKWSDQEIDTIVYYLQEFPEIEKPTAQIYYEKLIENCGINSTWKPLRQKVRHLKNLFNKASRWRESAGADLKYDDRTTDVEDMVLWICPHFSQLEQIFGRKPDSPVCDMLDYSNTSTIDDRVTNSIVGISFPELTEGKSASLHRLDNSVHLSSDDVSETESVPQNSEEPTEIESPKRQWSKRKTEMILDFLQENPDIEKPTAQIYYKKLIEQNGIDASWEPFRWKVRHLKDTFKKTNDWLNSTGAELLENGARKSSIEGKVLQMCPHFHQLKKIFGLRPAFEMVNCDNTLRMDDCTSNSVLEETISEVNEESALLLDRTDNEHLPSGNVSEMANVPQKAKDSIEKIRKQGRKSSIAHLVAFQSERTKILKIKMEREREKHEKELALSIRRLEAETERDKAEMEFKNRELDFKILESEKDERLKILEIEKDERLQKFQIEMKYKLSYQK